MWAVNKSWLTRLAWRWAEDTHQTDVLRRFATLQDGAAFRQLFLESDRKIVAAIGPFRRNQRLMIQKGIFLCPGNVRCRFEDILESLDGHDDGVFVVPISAGEKRLALRSELLRLLSQTGLDRASLFPGLDGFAQALRTRVPLFSHLQNLEESGARSNGVSESWPDLDRSSLTSQGLEKLVAIAKSPSHQSKCPGSRPQGDRSFSAPRSMR